MHDLVAAQDGIGGADLDAQRTADAPRLVNDGHRHRAFGAIVRIEGQYWTSCDFGQNGNALKTPGRALIDRGVILRYGLCIAFAIGKAAAGALRLGQSIVDAFSQ